MEIGSSLFLVDLLNEGARTHHLIDRVFNKQISHQQIPILYRLCPDAIWEV